MSVRVVRVPAPLVFVREADFCCVGSWDSVLSQLRGRSARFDDRWNELPRWRSGGTPRLPTHLAPGPASYEGGALENDGPDDSTAVAAAAAAPVVLVLVVFSI